MAKKGLDISTIQTVLKDVTITSGWALCIGAGTSIPVLPDWFSLVENLINNNCKKDLIEIDKYKKMGFSADAMIQAVKNKLNASDDRFIEMLSNEVFSPIKNNVNMKEWKAFVSFHNNCMQANNKRMMSAFQNVINKSLHKTSADKLAKSVIDSIIGKIGPKAILTFNGEAVFLALLNYYWLTKQKSNRYKFDLVIDGISCRREDRIPYIHCHGALPIIGTDEKTGKKARKANAKLVFSEESYLNLATSPLSWQSINFIEHCMNSKMVFVGVSLSDPNMRRWLGWIHKNKVDDLKNNNYNTKDVTEHFWINKKPDTDVEKTWIEESVAHLGVRLVWINEWDQVGEVLNKMLGI